MAISSVATQQFTFAVDSALLGELGEKLVSTVHVALTELVKNAYDADATRVTIEIRPEPNQASSVIVKDDGEGMTLDQVKKFWMKIGTTNKLKSPYSERFGRLKTGSKGIGRFACRRLGLKLRLETTAAIRNGTSLYFQTTTIVFNWSEFVAGSDVEEIICEGAVSRSKSGFTGTTLTISGGENDEWKEGGINFLKRQLAILASNQGARREGYDLDPGFEVYLDAPEFSGTTVDLRDEVINASWGTLSAFVDTKGRAHCKLNAHGLGGTKTYISEAKFKKVVDAKVRLGILPLDKKDARKPEILSNYAIREITDDWGGVQIRYNGFRMYPYGDARDDWLQIDKDRGRRLGRPSDAEVFAFASSQAGIDPGRALLNMLSMKSYLGSVEVDSSIYALKPRIDRQGFVENPAFDELRKFVRFVIDWANIWREYYIRLKVEDDAENARKAIEPILKGSVTKEMLVPKAVSYLRKEIKRIVQRLPPTQQKETEQVLIRTIKAIEARSEANQQQLDHLRLVASASTLTLLFAHEIRTIIGTLGANAKRLEQIAEGVPTSSRREILETAAHLLESRERFNALVDMTGIVGAFKKRGELQNIHLKDAVEKAVNCFHLVINGYHINIDHTAIPGDSVVGPMIGGELYAVLLNLISNAIKSVIAKGAEERRIKIVATTSGTNTVVRIIDNGVGLDEEFFDDVFTPFVSDPSGMLYDRLEQEANPEDMHLFGTGSGLGLSIVKDILLARNGAIRFISAPEGWSTCVEVVLP